MIYDDPTTVCDGLKTALGEINFPIIKKHVSDIVTVSEQEILDAMKLVYERLKIVIEPSSTATLAAVIKKRDYFEEKNVGVIFYGGNIDLKSFGTFFR